MAVSVAGVEIKPHLPSTKGEVEVLLAGTPVKASYDPRNGPGKKRSGVLRIGKGQLISVLGSGPTTLEFRLTDGKPEFGLEPSQI